MFPELPIPSKHAVLSVLSNLLGIAGLVAIPTATGMVAGGAWALLAGGVEALGLSYLVGLAAQQAKAKTGGPRRVERTAA